MGSSPEAIIGNTYVEILKKFKPKIEWDNISHEHKFSYISNGIGFLF